MIPPVPLSLPRQNYLEVIFALCEEHGHAHSKAIAARMGVSMPSVSEALQGLVAAGVIHYRQRQAATLTQHGAAIARELASRHAVLAVFYEQILGCDRHHADELACRVEHVVDADFIRRMQMLLDLLTAAMARAGVDSLLELSNRWAHRPEVQAAPPASRARAARPQGGREVRRGRRKP